MNYLSLKFLHVFVAIVGIGSSAALALVLTFFADDPAHGGFALRVVRRLLHAVVVPGYALMLASGMWMGDVAALLDARWTEAAMNLWGVGALLLALSSLSLKRQIRLFEAEGPASPACRRAARLGRLAGAGWGAVVVAILYFMVFKPA